MFNFLKKTISHKGKKYTSEDLKILRENWEKENYSPNEYQLVDKYAIKSLELTEKQLANLNKAKLSAKASSWKSRQRKLRREGKLEQDKIDSLNKYGMLWNPKEDLWEINYAHFRDYGMSDPIENWIKEQRHLFDNNRLSKDNLLRLEAANFPFSKKENEEYKLDIYQILYMQEQLDSGKKKYEDLYTQRTFLNPIKKISKEKKNQKELSKTQKKKIEELNQMTFEDFKFEIDCLFDKEYKMERIQGFIKSRQDHYSDIYFESFRYLNGTFTTGKVIDHLDELVKFKCPDEVVIYASEKALNLLDKNMLGSGKYNDIQRFPPVNKLILLYNRRKSGEDLIRISKIIFKHPVLRAIYGERINKILVKY